MALSGETVGREGAKGVGGGQGLDRTWNVDVPGWAGCGTWNVVVPHVTVGAWIVRDSGPVNRLSCGRTSDWMI